MDTMMRRDISNTSNEGMKINEAVYLLLASCRYITGERHPAHVTRPRSPDFPLLIPLFLFNSSVYPFDGLYCSVLSLN